MSDSNPAMLKLETLAVENFRCFRKWEKLVEFHPELTVLVARNGNGKSAILDAIRISLGTFSKAFESLSQSSISKSDATLTPERIEMGRGACYPVRVSVSGMVDGRHEEWERSLQDATGHTTSKLAKSISNYGEKLKTLISSDEGDVELPIIAYYGTGRLWGEESGERMNDDDSQSDFASEDRFAGYVDALTRNSIYSQVKRWMAYAFQVKSNPVECQTRIGRRIAAQYAAIEKAVNYILRQTGFKSPHYNYTYRDVAVLCEQPTLQDPASVVGSIPIAVSRTSDGVKAAISLVADIAYRCVRLNPGYGDEACEKTQGVVMIDEVDLFLHPSWQQVILTDMRTIFPRIQFIVTTHSPQVVSSVPRECIRVISDGEVRSPSVPTQAVELDYVLRGVFGTDLIPRQLDISKKLNELKVLAADGCEDEGRWNVLYQELRDHYGPNYGPLEGIVKHREFVLRLKRERSHA